ncbi:ABC transporter ATP-binding protein [Chryseomicrobium palamuruense]|uniref:ABC transporter ATP-binding protein n=1 Tax=Chryseomicrobium palamuruense TaxID=682973 RepID=A0ABV8UW59_9BACL
MDNILKVEDLKVTFSNTKNQVTVVDNINFHIEKGEALGIVGESGCGKSVTSLAIMRLLNKNGLAEGKIVLNGQDLLQIDEKNMRKIRGNQVAMIFQEPMTSLNPVLTIGKQISEVLVLHGGVNKREAKAKVLDLLKQVGIPRGEEIFYEYPHQLSGGMRQRIMISMAIACNPELLIADEPTTALDVTIQAQILKLLKKLQSDLGMSLVLITHDLGVIAEVCDRVLVMYAGEVIETADVRTLLRNPKHPYTTGLIKSNPHKSKGIDRLYAIPGNVPAPGEHPVGCRFAPRCEHAMAICSENSPEFVHIADNHYSKCWLYSDEHSKEVSHDYAPIGN